MRMIGFTLLALAAALRAAPATAQDDKRDDVVVTGARLVDSERTLRECIARKCPPAEDIAATLSHARNLFIAGDYQGARSTLRASRGRNFRFREKLPEPVAALVLANAFVAGHLGEGESARFESIVSLDVLKHAFAANDPRVLNARLELAYQRIRAGDFDEAITQFRAVENLAGNQPEVLGNALIAQVMIADRLTGVAGIEYRWVGERAKKILLSAKAPGIEPYVATLRILEARDAAARGDRSALDAALAAYSQHQPATKRPLLIYQPLVDFSDVAAPRSDPNFYNLGRGPSTRIQTIDSVTPPQAEFEKNWIDVGFWINPDGSVANPAVLRASKQQQFWEKRLLRVIANRRYAPFDLAARQFAQFRIERFTYTSDYGNIKGTRIRLRTTPPKIESIDLTGSMPETGNSAK